MADATLHLSLLLLRGVVVAVLAEVAHEAGGLDLVGDLDAAQPRFARDIDRIRHLPVAEGDTIIGVISIGDLVKAVIEDQKVELDQLQRYIAS